MARLEELDVARLNDEQIKRLEETEKLINVGGNQDIYLLALRKKK